jgi:cytoskeletal protein CcmA (bactofilin family)
MASLNNLYISQSYQGLVHFGSNTTASATLGVIEDGLGNSLGLFLNNNGDLRTTTSVSSSTIEATNLVIKNKIEITGSIDIDGPVTASSALIEGNLNVLGSLTASAIYTLIESASIIYSSGSNILGDSTADVQTLNGTVIVSGSEEITGSLSVTNNISSSTISGIGNVTLFSQSVDARLDFLEGPFSTSVDSRLDIVEATASLYVPFSQSVDSRLDIVEATASLYVPFSQSVDTRLDGLEATASYLNGPFSTSVDARLDALEAFTGSQGLVTTASFQAYTASIRTELDAIEVTTASLNTFTQSTAISLTALNTNSASVNISISNINSFTSSANSRLNNLEAATSSYANSASVAAVDSAQNIRINGLASFTGSYATTGSNTFRGSEIFSGSVNGQVFPITISTSTASMNCSLGNFFTVTLNSGSTRFEATNITAGQTISLKILNSTSGSQFTGSASVKFPTGFTYVPTAVSASTDIITFLSFDNSAIFAVAANYFA